MNTPELTMRDFFAVSAITEAGKNLRQAQAHGALLFYGDANEHSFDTPRNIAALAYQIADAMLKERDVTRIKAVPVPSGTGVKP